MNTHLCGKCGGPVSPFAYGCPHCGVALRGVQTVEKSSYALKQRAWEEREARRRAEQQAEEWRARWRDFRDWTSNVPRRIHRFFREIFGRVGQRIMRATGIEERRELRTLLYDLRWGRHVSQNVVRDNIKRNPSLAYARDKHGWTALHAAAGYAPSDVVPLYTAYSLTTISELLLSLKADVNAKTKDGITPLHCAAMSGRVSTTWAEKQNDRCSLAMIKLLLGHGADERARSGEGKDVRDYASQRKHDNVKNWLSDYRSFWRPDCKLEDLKHTITPDVATRRDALGETGLHDVARWGRAEVAELLLMNGADVEAEAENTDVRPLHYAAYFGNIDVAKVLLAHGAHLNAPYFCVDVASKNGHTDMVELLRAHKRAGYA